MIGLDTETINGYVRLLAIEDYEPFRVDSFKDILAVLSFVPVDKYVVYNLDYDVSAFVKYLSYNKKCLLFRGIKVSADGVRLHYIPYKCFSVELGPRLIQMFDVFQFFGCSLKTAAPRFLNAVKIDHKVDNLKEGDLDAPNLNIYAERDAALAGRLWRWFADRLPVSLQNVRPLSPAYLSAKYFAPELKSCRMSSGLNRVFRRSFHGGRFEVFRRGFFKDVWVYDIRSAYPYAMRDLKSTEKMRLTTNQKEIGDYGVHDVTLQLTNRWIGPFPLTTASGHVIFPVGSFRTTLTTSEYRMALQLEMVLKVHRHLAGFCLANQPVFAPKIERLYRLKQKPDGYAYKIMLNSLYGKTCQIVSSFRPLNRGFHRPSESIRNQSGEYLYRSESMRSANFALASEVTARTRLKLYEVINHEWKNTIAIATDSVFATAALPLPLSTKLGDWTLKRYDWLIMIGSGVYFWSEGGQISARFRGITIHDATELLDRMTTSRSSIVNIAQKRRLSWHQIEQGIGKQEDENLILEVVRKLDLNFDTKRLWLNKFTRGADLLSTMHESYAPFTNTKRRLKRAV